MLVVKEEWRKLYFDTTSTTKKMTGSLALTQVSVVFLVQDIIRQKNPVKIFFTTL